ncbi:MAG TPA: redoxin domain-containing protein [Candidatus Limnocylindrales bacterium]|nr:redoxin domain-containing protein [Candidatus Limnocylindrales bacterium]
MPAIFYVSYAALWLVVVFQSLVLLGLVRTVYRLNAHPSPDGSATTSGHLVGQRIPDFTAVDVSGNIFDHESLAGRVSALLFVTPDCRSCMATLAEVSALRLKVNGNLIIVCRAGSQECKLLQETYNLENVPVVIDEAHELSKLFDVHGSPTAVLVGASGVIQSYGHPMGADEFAQLLAGDGHGSAKR